MTTSLKNIGKSLINTNNYDETYHFKSISQGNEFNKYLTGIKNKAIEGFAGQSSLIDTSESVLLATQISDTQQAELTRLNAEYDSKQTRYNTLINTISSGTNNSNTLQEMKQLETTLDNLTQQINTLNNMLHKNITTVNTQITTNSIAREKYMTDITDNNTHEANMDNVSNNIQNMLNDSNIRTLQQNYSYTLFSIFAAASIIAAINIIQND